MRILHYSLGFSPYRTGGLVKYSLDLAYEQKQKGNVVFYVFPGRINFINSKVRFAKYKSKLFDSFEIINPQLVPLNNGISNPKDYMKKSDINIFLQFLLKNEIEIFHIHTLMGLHIEMVEAAKKLGIPVLFTTHDYYGLSTKPIIKYDVGTKNDFDSLFLRNNTAFSKFMVFIMQSRAYRLFGKKPLFTFLKRSRVTRGFKTKENVDSVSFMRLKAYFQSIFSMVDLFLFNSRVSKDIYIHHLNDVRHTIIPVTHRDIKFNKSLSKIECDRMRFAFFGGTSVNKGFDLVIKAGEYLYKQRPGSFIIKLFTKEKVDYPFIECLPPFHQEELPMIMSNIDIMLFPSVCFETFGFAIVEALSYHVPVIVSNICGASDFVHDDINGFLIEPNDPEDLYTRMLQCINDTSLISRMTFNDIPDLFLSKHTDSIIKIYNKELNKI